jgi:CBS domain-containing protein
VALTARDIMQEQVVTVSADDPLSSVRQLFVEESIHGAPVVDDRMRVLGVISTTDLLRAATEAHESERPEPTYYEEEGQEYFDLAGLGDLFEERLGETTASEYMSDGAVSVAPKAPIAEVARAFRENQVHRVLVVDEGVLQGLISTLDMIALLERIDPKALQKLAVPAR